MTETSPELLRQCDRLLELLASYEYVAVALSGGVDSAVVAKAARLACGDRAVALTALSASLAGGELDQARQIAAQIGMRHEVLATREFQQEGYVRNAGNRCYFCKSELYTRIKEFLAEVAGGDRYVICNGANLDDLGDYRPGMIAAREHQAHSPLIDAKLTKNDVRALARHWELPIWDKPASPCLSSRIAYGVEVTEERVRRVDAAEAFLKNLLGARTVRVRLEANDMARIELPLELLPLLTEDQTRQTVTNRLRALGFRYVTLDLEGFRSGSLNAALPLVQISP